MNNRHYVWMALALVGLVISILACNAPERATPEPQPPSPTATSSVPNTSPPEEVPRSPTPQADTEPTPMPTTPAPTDTPSPPTDTPSPTPTPTPTPPASAGPLDFPEPTALDSWQALGGDEYEATIIVRITGGAPPYTVYHDVTSFTTDETSAPIVFTASGCNALVHTIKVESEDGQSVSRSYYISPPWC